VEPEKEQTPEHSIRRAVDALEALAPDEWKRLVSSLDMLNGREREALLAIVQLNEEQRRLLFDTLGLGADLSKEPTKEVGKLKDWFGAA
jgi:hypothetical protein